ncbi:tripartite motif-containing protein 3 [Patella vulgata]|uniref:tripartite motif-containing protein 3 n=1 Tax=Patella vulgata TaxID=6465 RepID=UPI00218078C8|nr:tripartite motif-containing protein 3 [Patella vulgata]
MANCKTINNCSICLCGFTKPKILECFHSFCEKCLEDYAQKFTVNNQFPCALCRKKITIPTEGVKGFAVNFYIEEKPMEASVLQKCPDHVEQPLDGYCEDCGMIACQICLKSTHEGHDYKSLQDTRNDILKEMEKLKQKLHNQLPKFESYTTLVRSRISEIKETAEEVCKEIDQQVENITTKSRIMAQNLKKEVKTVAVEEEKKMNRLIVDAKNSIHQLKASRDYVGKILKTNSIDDIVNIKTLVQKQTQENEEKVLPELPKVQIMEFKANENIDCEFLSEQLGELNAIEEEMIEFDFNIRNIKDNVHVFDNGVINKCDYNWSMSIGKEVYKRSKSALYIIFRMDNAEDDVNTMVNLRLVNHKNWGQCIKKREEKVFVEYDNCIDWSRVIDLKKLSDPSNGFIDEEGKFTVRVQLRIIN